MKAFSIPAIMLLGMVFFGHLSHAQDLSALQHIAHWPLLSDTEDALHHLSDMETQNGALDPVLGIFSNGIYPADDPENASYFRTPSVTSLFDSAFAIQLQFRLGEFGQINRPVVVLGEGYRWLGLQTRYDSVFIMLVNNDTQIEIPEVLPQPGVYYEFTLTHDLASHRTEVFLDGEPVLEFQIPLVRIENDNRIANVNPSTGRAFHGYWRHLHVYGSDEISAIREWLEFGKQIQVHPNPAVNMLELTAPWPGVFRYEILDDHGGQWIRGIFSGMHHQVGIQSLPAGSFVVRFFSENGIMIRSCKVLIVR